jgi:glycosyltransferase involved in cell wall biosynthesis
MKVLEINKFYYRKGGADKHFLDVSELLQKEGHEVAVFAMHSQHNLETPWKKYFLSEVGYVQGYSVWQKIKGAFRMFYSLEAKRKINQLLDEFQPEVVHVHNIYHQLSPCILFEIKKRNIPIIMTVHDFKLINPNHALYLDNKAYDRCRDGKYYQCFLDKCVKNSYSKSFLAMLEAYWHKFLGTYRKNIDLFIAPSDFVKNTLTEWGIPAEKITVLPHFIPESNPDIISILPSMEEMSQNEDEKYALYVGRISKEKGAETLIDIFQNISGLKLFLAGAVENGFVIPKSEKIKQLGFLSQSELQKYIAGASVIVSGSKLPETFGLVALEAIAEGNPFIGFETGAFSEIIRDGQNGYLVSNNEEFKNRIEQIAEGKVSFDPNVIRSEAKVRFAEQKYVKALLNVFGPLAIDKNTKIC